MKKKTKDLLRISELAARAGVSASTIKHYVNEGLILQALKTGKNMAYYDESCVDKIRLIKKIQKEKFLPLDVIKRIIESGEGYDEELELGKAILKTSLISPDTPQIVERQIEQYTGYPLKKIHLLEKEELIIPEQRNGVKYYDAADCRIIDMMKQREEAGLPMDFSLGTINIYRDAIRDAVRKDIHYFTQNLLGDVPTSKAVDFMTEADDQLYDFMVLYRQKLQRRYSEEAIRQLNVLPQKLSLLSIFPLPGREMKVVPGEKSLIRVLYSFCMGDYDDVLKNIDDSINTTSFSGVSFSIIAHLLKNEIDRAYELVEQRVPEVTHKMMENAAASLACIFAISASTGLSRPIFLAKKAMGYLKRTESSRESNGVVRLFSLYICGAAYTILPEVFNVFERGIEILEAAESELRSGAVKKGKVPGWFERTLDFEVFPAVEIRVNRFLAEGYLALGALDKAEGCLRRIVTLDEPSSEHARWARMELLDTQS